MQNTDRFTARAENYVRYRPHYPVGLISCLREQTGLTPSMIIADIGAGTGISSIPFLENGNKVFGVEPNLEMREMSQQQLQGFPGYIPVAGTAEHTGLGDDSVDMIVAGQAFHWFNQVAARKEFRRISRPGTSIVLMWNERKISEGFDREYDQLIREYSVDYKDHDHRNIGPAQITSFYCPSVYRVFTLEHAQHFDYEGIRGRLLSSSYSPQPGERGYEPMMDALEMLFDKYQRDGRVSIPYITRVYTGKVDC